MLRGAARSGLRRHSKGRLRAGPCPATRSRRWAGQAAGQAATQLSKAALHMGTAALCLAAHACTHAARFFPRWVLQSIIHSPSAAAAPLVQSPIPWAQAATQAAGGGSVWAPTCRTRTMVPPSDAAHARTYSDFFTDLMTCNLHFSGARASREPALARRTTKGWSARGARRHAAVERSPAHGH